MAFEVDSERFIHSRAIRDEIVEALAAHIVLQFVDDRKAAVVQHENNHLLCAEHRRIDIGIHQQVGAVTAESDCIPFRFFLTLRNTGAPCSGNLIPHAGKPELNVHRANILRPPVCGNFRRQAACRGDNAVSLVTKRVHNSNGLRI